MDSVLRNRDSTLLTKVHLVKAIFSSSHVQMWELDHKDGLVLKNWCFWTVVLEKTTESPLDCKEIKPVNPKENQSWIFIGRTDAEAEAPILWPPDGTANLLEVADAEKDWQQEEKEATENEMVEWIVDSMDMNLSKHQETVDREAWRAAVYGVAKSRIWLSHWTTRNMEAMIFIVILLESFYLDSIHMLWCGCFCSPPLK